MVSNYPINWVSSAHQTNMIFVPDREEKKDDTNTRDSPLSAEEEHHKSVWI